MKCFQRLATAIVFVALAALPAHAQTKVKFALDWLPQGPQAPFITAKASGAFRAGGLDVTIDRGAGSQKTIEQVATGTYDLGYGDINSMIEYNVKNPGNPLIAIAMVLNTPPFALLSLKKYEVREPKDLAGKAIGAPAGDAPRRPMINQMGPRPDYTRVGEPSSRTSSPVREASNAARSSPAPSMSESFAISQGECAHRRGM